jgi:hypothetical protein
VRIVVTDADNLDLASHQSTLPANSARVRVAVQFALSQATARQRIELIAPDGSLYDYIEFPTPTVHGAGPGSTSRNGPITAR